MKRNALTSLLFAVVITPVLAAPEMAPLTVEAVHAASPSKHKPLAVAKDDAKTRKKWRRIVRWYQSLPADKVTAHPQAAEFPGPVAKTAKRVDARVEIRLDQPRWQSTGLYAAPGEMLTVKVPKDLCDAGLKLRIGCHKDNISPQTKWRRFPAITRTFPLDRPVVQAANAFGGLVYIEVPRRSDAGGWRVPTFGGNTWLDQNPSKPTPATLRVRGAVRAPWFRLGTTTPDEWRKSLAETGAPWGEIAGKDLVISLPIDVLRGIDDPAALAAWWDGVLAECWSFAGYPGQRTDPERFVPDLEISAGSMHSGYPIMCHLTAAKALADLETLKKQGKWGFFHELGHNHQGLAWTFDGLTEVTVNLHTLNLMRKICGLSPGQARKPFADLDTALRKRLVDGKTGPFDQLALYIPLIQQFGAESLTKTFQTYLNQEDTKRLAKRRGANNGERMDAWVLRYSKTVGRDCSAYFALFDIEASAKTRKELSGLKPWMPEKDFAKRYGKKMTSS